MRAHLTRHPESRSEAIRSISVEVEREGTELLLRYAVAGAIDRILLPSASALPQRRDDLWQSTCFEAFVRPARSPAYHELNLAPSGDWALYHFEAERSGRSAPEVSPPAIDLASSPDVLTLRASIDLATLLSPAVPWELNLTAVIADPGGGMAYWALAHPPGAPDFHHPDCFVLDLPPPAAA